MKKETLIIMIVLLVIWVLFFGFLIRKANILQTNPCNSCAKLMGSEVTCTTTGAIRVFYEDGTYEDTFEVMDVRQIDLDYLEKLKNYSFK